jgi:hypothetical protein
MIPLRNIAIAATTAFGLSITALAASATEASAATPCQIVDADVESGTAMFTVGPADCVGEVGPISFSTYALPNRQIQPYDEQVLIAHSDQNGRSYAAGTYTLTATVGEALNWQADLYMGDSIDVPPQPHTFAVDAQTGITSATQTTIASQPSVEGLTGTEVQSFAPAPAQQARSGSLPLTGGAPARVLLIAAGATVAGFAIKRLSRVPTTS